jgi:flavorubredoxin
LRWRQRLARRASLRGARGVAVAQIEQERLICEKLAYVILLHFEPDECGGMDRFLEDAMQSVLACSELSVALNLSG